ncbi:hypothetical protein Hanom_Chr02g00175581 [Helianthus anomalus]
MENLTTEDARQQFLRILRMLPYGDSVFLVFAKLMTLLDFCPEASYWVLTNVGFIFSVKTLKSICSQLSLIQGDVLPFKHI